MNKNTTTKKVTKAQRNSDIITMLQAPEVQAALESVKVKYGTTATAAIEHLTHENTLLAKKNTTNGGNKKLTKAQKENEGYKKDILTFLRANPSRLITATEAMTEILAPAYPAVTWTNQKAAALLNAMSDKRDKDTGELISEGILDRVEGKGKTKTTFQIKPEYVSVEAEDCGEDMEDEVEDHVIVID